MAVYRAEPLNTLVKHMHLAHKKLEQKKKLPQEAQSAETKKEHAAQSYHIPEKSAKKKEESIYDKKLLRERLEELEKKYFELKQRCFDDERLKAIKSRIDSTKNKLSMEKKPASKTVDPKLLHTEHPWLKEGLDELSVPFIPHYPEEETAHYEKFEGYDARFPMLEPPGPMPEMKERAEQLSPMPHLDTDYAEPAKSSEKEKKGILSKFFGKK